MRNLPVLQKAIDPRRSAGADKSGRRMRRPPFEKSECEPRPGRRNMQTMGGQGETGPDHVKNMKKVVQKGCSADRPDSLLLLNRKFL